MVLYPLSNIYLNTSIGQNRTLVLAEFSAEAFVGFRIYLLFSLANVRNVLTLPFGGRTVLAGVGESQVLVPLAPPRTVPICNWIKTDSWVFPTVASIPKLFWLGFKMQSWQRPLLGIYNSGSHPLISFFSFSFMITSALSFFIFNLSLFWYLNVSSFVRFVTLPSLFFTFIHNFRPSLSWVGVSDISL